MVLGNGERAERTIGLGVGVASLQLPPLFVPFGAIRDGRSNVSLSSGVQF
jgi:hypothetical protein